MPVERVSRCPLSTCPRAAGTHGRGYGAAQAVYSRPSTSVRSNGVKCLLLRARNMRFLGISLIVVGLALICGAFIFWPRVPEPKAAWDLRNEWESKNPAPQSRRSFRKWSGRAEKYDDQIGIDTKQDAAVMAQSEYQSAQDKLARLAALNSDELVARSSASLIFEGGILEETRHYLQMEGQLVAFSVGHGWSLVQRVRCVRGGHQMAGATIHGDDAKLAKLAQKMSELVAEEKALSDDALIEAMSSFSNSTISTQPCSSSGQPHWRATAPWRG